MKNIYLLFVLIFLSCAQNTKEKKGESIDVDTPVDVATEIENAVETTADEMEAAAEPSEHVTTTFKEELLKLKLKSVPLVDSTSFDSFIDESDYKTINAAAFQLDKIYKDWYNENYKHRAVSAYRLHLSSDFYTVVVTVLQGDEVMESKLINYDLEGNVIASEMIAYDEIVESWTRTKSTIGANLITHHYQYKVSEETSIVKIEPNGNLKQSGVDDIFYELVIKALNINHSKLIPTLQTFKIRPKSPNEAIVVIPEIAVGSEEEGDMELNTHIALVNVATKEITHQYFESHQTNGWISDAVYMSEIIIDTAPYYITENVRAFGIRTSFIGSSKVNPYENETLSLFVKSGDKLQIVLHNFEMQDQGGEWDGDCEGEFIREKRTLIISEEKTNAYFNILIKAKITESIAFEDENGDCDSKDTVTSKISVLRFDGEFYKEEILN